jgi:hypothetical protein
MTETTGATTLPANTLTLPGRTVEVEMSDALAGGRPYWLRGIVIDVTLDGVATVLMDDGAGHVSEQCTALRPVNPDRPTLAHDDLIAGALGVQLAERAGPEAFAGFHRGHNDGRIAFTEAAREMLRQIDVRALVAKHQRCGFTYVIDPRGNRHTDPGVWNPGDQLVECAFYVDGPGTIFCGAHLPGVKAGTDRSSIFYATDEQRDSGEAILRAPLTVPEQAPEVPRVLTEVEVRQAEIAALGDVMRAVLIDEAQQRAADAEGGADWSGMPAREMRAAVEAVLAARGERVPLMIWWEAIAEAVRQHRIVMHSGPAYSPAPDYMIGTTQ